MKRSEINTLRQMRAALKAAQASIGKNLHQILDDDGEYTYCLQSLRDINRALLASYAEYGRPGQYVVSIHRCGARGTRTDHALIAYAECGADARAAARRMLGVGSNVAVVSRPWAQWAAERAAMGMDILADIPTLVVSRGAEERHLRKGGVSGNSYQHIS